MAAVCRRDLSAGQALATQLTCDYEADAHALIARKDIDAIVFVTVPWLLEDLLVAALAAGKRVLVEKPVAHDLASGKRILAAVEANNAFCMAGQTLRFNTVANALRTHAPELGRLDSLIFSQRFPPQLQLDWLDDPERSGGGNILHTGVHCFDLIRYIAGFDPATVSCTTRSVYTKNTEDSFVAEMELAGASAPLAMVSCSRTTASRNGLIEISGENGQLVGDHVLNTLYRIDADAMTRLDPGPPRQTVLEALRAFAEDIRADRPPRIAFRDGLAAVATADACYRSTASQRRESVVMP